MFFATAAAFDTDDAASASVVAAAVICFVCLVPVLVLEVVQASKFSHFDNITPD